MQAFRHPLCAIMLAWLSLFGACEWTPEAGPVQPERLAAGEFVVRGMLDRTFSRFAWASLRDGDRNRHFIFDIKSRTSCELPKDTFPTSGVLQAPAKSKQAVFLWALVRQDQDLEQSLVFVDERCKMSEFFTTAGSAIDVLKLSDELGSIGLVNDRKGRLTYVDPWREKENLIATGVGGYAVKSANTTEPSPSVPRSLWMIEKGQLRLRDFDGTLRASIGKDVTAFRQGAFSQLRVAFIAGGTLYEAVEPDYRPVPLQADACEASYGGTTLSFFSPCEEKQLVRIDLTSGVKEEFLPDVIQEFEVGGLTFEREQRGNDDPFDLYVTTPDGVRTQIEPALGGFQVLDANTIAGTAPDQSFGLWTFDGGYTPILQGVTDIRGFVDSRTTAVLWLVHHDLKDGLGTLSLLERNKFKLTTLANKVPAGQYSIGSLQQVPEPILMVLRNAKATDFDQTGVPTRFQGTLEVMLVSGDLPSKIDEQVSSYMLVYDPEAGGLLYTVDSGDSQGLWFAAL